MSLMDKYQQQVVEREATFVAEGFDLLNATGVARVLASYDGAGDSGCIESVSFIDSDQKEVPDLLGNLNGQPLCKMVEDFCYDVLENWHSGWENNDGAFGNVVIDVKERKVTIKHNERYTETNYSEDEVTL